MDLERCVGCMGCVIACKAENGTPPSIHWMKVLEKEEGEFPYARRTFTPVRCNHCDDPPCARACPTGAITLEPASWTVDAGRCILCAACEAACPRDAIRLGQRFELAAHTREGLQIVTPIGRGR